jgi:hypothetical protein
MRARANWCGGSFSEPGFGLKVGKTTPMRFEERIRELVAGQLVESRRGVFRYDAKAISVRGNPLQRPDLKERDGSLRAVL